ncbi:NIL domain-containing protein, partial [Lysinibacillus fusiformis]
YGSVREIQEKFYGNLLVSFEGHSDKIPSVLTELQDIVTVEEVKFNEG